jgi:preprotein translocase subunit SecA
MIDKQVENHLVELLGPHYGAATFAQWAGSLMGVELDAADFQGLDLATAQRLARDEASRMAEGQVLESIDENLPEDEEPSEWNWEALARQVNTRWKLNVRDRDLKRLERPQVGETLLAEVRQGIERIDLSEGEKFLAEDFGIRAACAWVHFKFGKQLDLAEVRKLDPAEFKALVHRTAIEAYDEKEVEYPVMAGLAHFTTRDAQGQRRYDRERLVAWARERFHVDLDVEDLRNKQSDAIRALLIEHSRAQKVEADKTLAEVEEKIHEIFADEAPDATAQAGNGHLESLADWLARTINYTAEPAELAPLRRGELEGRLTMAVEDRYRPEMRRMERTLILQILDTAWKEHLLAMDHLRSSVGLRGYAQVDPKVEYKREGMRIYEQMWNSVDEQVTDLVFRMEQLDESFVGSTWVESEAIHDSPPPDSVSSIAAEQQTAIENTESDKKPEPIRNTGERVGRNDPCPCGSGKKFKNCHMRKGGGPPAKR